MAALYFAYGSNLDTRQMDRRCPGAELLAQHATLGGYRLDFAGRSASRGGGVATVTPATDATVRGRLWLVDQDHVLDLDRYEGHPYAYRRQRWLIDVGGVGVRAYVYVKRAPLALPTTDYLRLIRRAYRRNGWDEGPVLDAVWRAALAGDQQTHGQLHLLAS